LVADRRGAVDVIEVAHESVLRQWPELAGWLNADAADLVLGLDRACAEWIRSGRDDRMRARRDQLPGWIIAASGCDSPSSLPRARISVAVSAPTVAPISPRAVPVINGSCGSVRREQARLAEIAATQRRTAKLQRIVAVTLAAVLIAVVTGAGVEWRQRQINIGERAASMTELAQIELSGVDVVTDAHGGVSTVPKALDEIAIAWSDRSHGYCVGELDEARARFLELHTVDADWLDHP
jgi:hypothetical protein